MGPWRICIASLDLLPSRSSGLAVYGETLVRGLRDRGHDVTVVTSRRGALPPYEVVEGIPVHRVPTRRADWIGFAYHAGRAIARLERAQPFDVVHFLDVHFAYGYGGRFVASLFQSFRQRATSDGGLPYHANLKGLIGRIIYYHGARWLAEAPALRRAERLLAASQATADEFVTHYGVDRARITHVPLGIDLARFCPRDATALRERLGLGDAPLLLYVGFCTPRKGLDVLARALPLLPPTVRLLVVGRWDAAYRAKFYHAIGPAAHQVIEAGPVADDDLALYYSMADVFVFPTLLEGFGLPLIEAMACETTVVATQTSAVPEALGPGGRVVPPRDPAALAAAIAELLADPEACRRLGRAGRAWVEARYDRSRMVTNTLAVYERFVREDA
jgi:glycosyltransferase involved in cell wall biosynthesis